MTLGKDTWTTQPHLAPPQEPTRANGAHQTPRAWIEALAAGRGRAALTFAGQGTSCLSELGDLLRLHPHLRAWLLNAEAAVTDLLALDDFAWSGLYDRGFTPSRWLQTPESRPGEAYLTSSAVSQPLIFITQLLRFLALRDQGLGAALAAGAVSVVTGHSQGMMPALLVAESPGGGVRMERFLDYVRYFTWQGLHMALAYAGVERGQTGDATPMAAVSGLDTPTLQSALDRLNATLQGGAKASIALYNTRTRHVVSGPSATLHLLRAALAARQERAQQARRQGRHGGRLDTFTWEYLPVGAAFHSAYMAPGLDAMWAQVQRMGFRVEPAALHLTVLSPEDGTPLNERADLTRDLVVAQFVRPVRWGAVSAALAACDGLEVVLDLGPGIGAARLTQSNLRGFGLHVLALSEPGDLKTLLTPGARPAQAPLRYADLTPGLATLPDGRTVIDNRYTRWTGRSPVILPGMTPTTVEAPLVVAAANAGFTAELAGGGQVTEAIFHERLKEVRERLAPGAEIAFNALFLDPYLWGLHLGRQRLVQKARAQGAPIEGVTISAGLPEVEEAVRLLDELAALGITRNALKPGTLAQIQQVVRIARAAPHHTLIVHLEGGRAGGHHSWEELEDLLVDGYAALRAEPNLILCVGGGVGTPERAAALLTGAWSLPLGLPPMPVDGVLLGTVTMACAEACTSPQVKQALVEAAGSDRWVFHGDARGGVTSGRSQLNADIHYLDNAAARCGRLLDEVAGDAAQVAARRDEIIAALNATARPWLGEVGEMTYAQLIARLVELMAIGRGGRYEDGPWLDASWRRRVFDVLRRAEARLAGADEGEIASIFEDLASLDAPGSLVERLVAAYPDAARRRVHPLDQQHLLEVCRQPGKPVPFVPVIDADVRRWYKADSLWAAHDDRFRAEQVLVIPGPAAVAGITRADEPVAALLARFEEAAVAALLASGVQPGAARSRGRAGAASLPVGIEREATATGFVLRALPGAAAWFDYAARALRGAPAAFLGAARLYDPQRRSWPNPIQRLCPALPGATLAFTQAASGEVVEARWSREAGSEEAVVLRAAGERLTLEVQLGAPQAQIAKFVRNFDVISGEIFVERGEGRAEALRSLYHVALFGEGVAPAPLFSEVREEVVVDAARARAYGALTGGAATAGEIPVNMTFSLVWRPMMRALSCDELAAGLLELVHLSQRVTPGPGWPLRGGERLEASARVVRVEDAEAGRTIAAEARLLRGDVVCATLVSRFFIRSSFGESPWRVRADEVVEAELPLRDSAAAEHLASRPWLRLAEGVAALRAGEVVRLEVRLREETPRSGEGRFGAAGALLRGSGAGAVVIGEVALDGVGAWATHPVRATLEAMGWAPEAPARPTPPRTLASQAGQTPARMDAFASVSADLNPIHRSALMAALAGLDAPIVHGMWTSARLEALAVEVCGQRPVDWSVEFLAPAPCGAPLHLEATRTAARGGAAILTLRAAVVGADGAKLPVATATAALPAPRTAYVLPGQGIQQQGMGMDGYQRSAAAREVWDRADRATRRSLGFSILRVVRDNPQELIVNGVSQLHPRGVIHLTHFTQVAMAVLAVAQVAELREAGAFIEDAVACGHSVGEYNALAAIIGVLPLEDVIEIVYQRGTLMHRFVPRDAHGESGYRMGVIRPHDAGLDHAAAEALVEQLRVDTNQEIQIVNYNIKGRQYSVTGRIAALRALEAALEARRRPGAKPPWIEVPGIDVPFHSRVLRGGVEDFRRTLDQRLPRVIDPERLVGRYIPNLVARPFALDRPFAQAILACTESHVVASVLEDFEAWSRRPEDLARVLLIELLAWQFASPVRWIETQDLLLAAPHLGGLGVERVVEIGVGYQPTLTNMARATLALHGPGAASVELLNAESDADRVLLRDADPAPSAEPEPAPAAPAAAPVAAPVVVAAPVAAAGAAPPPDRPVTHLDALRAILALQAKVRPEQLRADETIDDLFEGVSSRRNQALLDLGAEFDAGAIDGAHEKPLQALADELRRRSPGYRAPGRYLRVAVDDALTRTLGRARLRRRDAEAHLRDAFALSEPWIERALLDLALASRAGDSSRGGALGPLADAAPTTAEAARALLDRAALRAAEAVGVPLAARASAGGAQGAVDAAAVQALADRITGPQGVLANQARAALALLGERPEDQRDALANDDAAARQLQTWLAEHGDAYAKLIAPRFEPRRHVAHRSAWAWAQRDVARLLFEGRARRLTPDQIDAEARRLALAAADPRVQRTAAWAAAEAARAELPLLAAALTRVAAGDAPAPAPLDTSRPHLAIDPDGALRYEERPSTPNAFLASLDPDHAAVCGWEQGFRDTLAAALQAPLDFRGRTALVTGASPGSIALEVVRHLLRGGARVVLTTTNDTPERLKLYQDMYQDASSLDAELHIVPFNQASYQDTDALVSWLFEAVTEPSGATVKVLKRPFAPDLILPFGALSDLTTLDQPSERSLAVVRAMLLGVERLIGGIARRYRAEGLPKHPCHVVLPLSPNHGAFGGDGAYAETKAALEVMLQKWTSERHAWGEATTLVGARIGWVRGTGLMDANNTVAAHLEERTGARTFSSGEMGLLIAALCTRDAGRAALQAPLRAELTGAFDRIPDVRAVVEGIRAELSGEVARRSAGAKLRGEEAARLRPAGAAPVAQPLLALPDPFAPPAHAPGVVEAASWPTPRIDLRRAVVLIGAGEVGPWGHARARFEVEVEGALSAGAVVELAWMTGLVRFEAGRWIDAASGDPVPEAELASRYRAEVAQRGGIRFIDPQVAGYDPERLPVMARVYLERDMTFPVGSAEEARLFLEADPDTTRVHLDPSDQTWRVTRLAGAEVRVPRTTRIKRRVAGLVPTGFSFIRYGISQDMVENIDRTTLFNLVATVDAFLSAGVEPEDLLRWVHPARIANTQGSGIGGMRSIQRLYIDPVLGHERQSDVLQETLINVIAAYVVQSYVGSYGAMTHPVAACATAAVSLEEAMDKILGGRADLAIAGAFDDIGREGALGFEDMAATCDTDLMLSMGLAPHQMSRANDARRRGFVEAQGGGTFLVARGDVALELGLPVLGVLAWAGSFSDGVHKSIPAPGMGALAAACGGPTSPLGVALHAWGLTADDIHLVYKHDTSTHANDPNETALHHRIQEALGRTPGNPLWAVSQKTLTGHPKGGAAAWQVNGLCQSLQRGVVPGNRNLECVDDAMRPWSHVAFSDAPLRPGPGRLRAGLVTSLGFGHVGAIALILHPAAFVALLSPQERERYDQRATSRLADARERWARVWMGERDAFARRAERRFNHPDHTPEQEAEEAALLLNPNARLDPSTGRYTLTPSPCDTPSA